RDRNVTGVQTCALPIYPLRERRTPAGAGLGERLAPRRLGLQVRFERLERSSERRVLVTGICQRLLGGIDRRLGFLHVGRLLLIEIGRASCRERDEYDIE